jgi:hypothetical protein
MRTGFLSEIMNKHKVGSFKGSVWGPYPCWCEVEYGGAVFRLHHEELSDLEYLILRMKREAKLKLGKDKDEV